MPIYTDHVLNMSHISFKTCNQVSSHPGFAIEQSQRLAHVMGRIRSPPAGDLIGDTEQRLSYSPAMVATVSLSADAVRLKHVVCEPKGEALPSSTVAPEYRRP